jgi:hypothetical protein
LSNSPRLCSAMSAATVCVNSQPMGLSARYRWEACDFLP